MMDIKTSNVGFTSDWHLCHKNNLFYSKRFEFVSADDISNYEKTGLTEVIDYQALTRMEDTFIENTNKCIPKDGYLFYLGDLIYSQRYNNKNKIYQKAKEIFDRINCKNIIFILGNHDKFFDIWDNANKAISSDEFFSLFIGGGKQREFLINNKLIIFSHFAMCIWNQMHRKSWHLYAHSHSNAEEKLNSLFPHRRSIDVGVDNAKKLLGEYRPFMFNEIDNIFNDRQGEFFDHHK